MLSLREMRRAAGIFMEKFTGATLRRVMPDKQELILVFEQATGKSHILLSCKPEYEQKWVIIGPAVDHPGFIAWS